MNATTNFLSGLPDMVRPESNKDWIPETNEIVTFKNTEFTVVNVNMGGKCTIKNKSIIKEVDINELSPFNPSDFPSPTEDDYPYVDGWRKIKAFRYSVIGFDDVERLNGYININVHHKICGAIEQAYVELHFKAELSERITINNVVYTDFEVRVVPPKGISGGANECLLIPEITINIEERVIILEL